MLIPNYRPLDILLAKEGKNRTYVTNELNISPATLAKMNRGGLVAMSVLLKICDHFDVPIQDVVQFVRVDEDGNEIEGEA